jgi:2-oxo-3-hexenedioate decarboxylase
MDPSTKTDLTPVEHMAHEMLAALDARRQIAPLSKRNLRFDLDQAYKVTSAVRRLREARGKRVVGRKIGFTNRTIWPEYGVDAPIWGYLYDTTVKWLTDGATLDLSPFMEPRIEPEIAFGLSSAPDAAMDERALLSCIEWVAHAYEIVQSPFPGWRFTAADTVAAFGLHGALLIGPTQREEWLKLLPAFGITLQRNGSDLDHGSGANVLGGPLSALRHLVGLLDHDPDNPPLSAGEIVSTGTLTRAFPIAPGEHWHTRLSGIPLSGVDVTFR